MSNIEVEMVGDTPGDIQRRLGDVNMAARKRTNEALMKTAREVKDDLEGTSPVDTREYLESWYIFPAKEDEVWILNEADHAKYVMLPNSRMQGSAKADLPASGILHNVLGVARGHQKGLSNNMAEKLKDMINAFSVS